MMGEAVGADTGGYGGPKMRLPSGLGQSGMGIPEVPQGEGTTDRLARTSEIVPRET